MRRCSQRCRCLSLLIATQIGLLAVGCSVFCGFVLSAVSRSTAEAGSAALIAETDDLARTIARAESHDQGQGDSSANRIREILQAEPRVPGVRWTLVDPQWRVRAVLERPEGAAAPDETDPASLPLIKSPGVAGSGPDRIVGEFVEAGWRHVGLAYRLRDGTGYVVADRPLDAAELAPAASIGMLPVATLIAWIWGSAVLSVATYLIVTRFFDQFARDRAQAEAAALSRIHSLVRTRDAIIFGLAQLAESRDETTGHHLERIAAYAFRLAGAMLRDPRYRDVVTPEFVRLVGISSALHDIGKVGIEDAVLLKNRLLTRAERTLIKQHTVIGGQCLLEIERHLGSTNFLQMAREIALAHHEHWDGSGYPKGLIGKEIPLAARIVAIADVYDALSTRRSYKPALPHEECVAIIRGEAGKQFDPDLVAIFLRIEGSFRQIARQYADREPAGAVLVPEAPISNDEYASAEDDVAVAAAASSDDWPLSTSLPRW